MAKHTKEPWEIGTPNIPHPDEAVGKTVGIVAEHFTVADVYDDFEDPEQAKANARLIAAAPDLLEALRMVLDRWTFSNDQQHTHNWHDWADCMKVILLALSKATEAEGAAK